MNKRLCLSTAALTLLSPFAAFADDPTGPTVWDGFSGWLAPDWSRDFSATLGVKIWINEWSRDSFISQPAFGPDGELVSRNRYRTGLTRVRDQARTDPSAQRQIQVAVRDR